MCRHCPTCEECDESFVLPASKGLVTCLNGHTWRLKMPPAAMLFTGQAKVELERVTLDEEWESLL